MGSAYDSVGLMNSCETENIKFYILHSLFPTFPTLTDNRVAWVGRLIEKQRSLKKEKKCTEIL